MPGHNPRSINPGLCHDQVNGDDGDDVLYGEDDVDALKGGDGNDELHRGTVGDSLGGGAGADLKLDLSGNHTAPTGNLYTGGGDTDGGWIL